MKIGELVNKGTCFNVLGLVLSVLVTVFDQVRSQRSTRWSEGSLRLIGGRTKHEGTVLIYHWSRWGAICDDYWDIRDANVVCNELGFAGAKEAPRRSRFGKGRRRVWLSGLHCRGNERHLSMCYSRGWGNHVSRCKSYWSSAGVVCNRRRTTTTTTTTTTTRPTTTTKKATTTTITTPRPTTTPRTTTTKATTTTTKPRPTTTKTTTTTTTPRPVTTTTKKTTQRPTTTEITTQKPTTTKTTSKPTTTTTKKTTAATIPPPAYNKWIYDRETWRYVMYYRDGTFITSAPDPRYYRARNTTTSTTTTTARPTPRHTPRPRPIDYNTINNRVDTSNNNNNNNNGIEVALGNSLTNNIDANSPQDNSQTRHEHHRRRNHNSLKDGYLQDQPVVDPEDTDLSLNEITVDNDDSSESIETNQDELEPQTIKPTAPGYTEYRLTGGRDYKGYKEGRMEVRLANTFTWGVICGDNWELRAAMVACRHFNAGYARQAHKTDYYGGSTMDKVVATLRCTGKEERLEDCEIERYEKTPGKTACSKPQAVAGVICETRLPDLEPDLKAIEESVFLRDRYLYYLQCAYEEKCLSSSADALYGSRTLKGSLHKIGSDYTWRNPKSWAYASRRLLHFSTIAKNIGTADFRPDIDRSQWEWHACHQHYHSMESFSHYDIIDSHGNQIAEGHKASFCLEDTRCDRGVHPKYSCEGFGYQGISVGCADSYLADIDCQWIDVTDVNPGTYTLKVELNPNMKVPEISFDNNVARCTLYFSARQARVYDCKLDTLL